MRENGIVIAIDGPAGAGKSTTARLVADQMGYLYLDTGAMYRAVGLAVLQQGVDPDDADGVTALCRALNIEFETRDGQLQTLLNGKNISDAIRSPEISQAASRVAVHPGVRDVLVALQRTMGRDGGIVLEGRDTGTAIFPDAELKIFLVADPAERARRRLRDLEKRGESAVFESLLDEIRIRDIRDRQTQLQRGVWPASDAVCIDTTGLSIAEQVDRIVALAQRQNRA
jgi:cytidylate kinase